ncbi:ROK family protein, partial [Kitasatospora sp. NPDC047058]|uniref:ROK family protein n=1 Tax=Kitasatospora sp. NPDC047058 TaxID=3155620 RepID=UPI0033C79531
MTVLALDVGGTGIKGAVVAADGTVRCARHRPTRPESGADAVTAAVLDAAAELAALAGQAGLRPEAVGLVVPGILDEARGVVVRAVNLGWVEVPIRRRMAEHLGLPVAFGHDVRQTALVGELAERLGAPWVSEHLA